MTETTLQQEDQTQRVGNRFVLVIEEDLFFSVRIETTLKRCGYDVQVIGRHDAAVARAMERTPALIIVNFGSDRLSPAETVRKIKALPHPSPILGFVPHKWMKEVRPTAMGAGCDLLVANSALVMRLPQLAAKLAPLDGEIASVDEAAEIAREDEE